MKVQIDYAPRKAFLPYHERKDRWACLVCHRRAGKTVAAVNDDIKACMESVHWKTGKPLERFAAAYIAPTYSQAKRIAWDYAKIYAGRIPGVKFNENELRIDFPNGARYRLYGAENYDSLRGIYLDKCTLDEPADMDPRAFSQVIRPALSDREGRATWIGTPKGHNDFHKKHIDSIKLPGWFSMVLKASESGLIAEGELEDARQQMSEDEYDQEYECSFEAAIVGAYYGQEMKKMDYDGRICNVPFDPHVPVYTSWDLGLDDSTAITFWQQVRREFRIIDYYENSDAPLNHYIKKLREKMVDEGYVYGDHYLPHDVKARELQSGKSRLDVFYELGVKNVVVGRRPDVASGIENVRRLLTMTWIDETKCERLIEALKLYQREFDAKNKVFRQKPKHDWASHGADSVRTFAENHVEDQFREMDIEEDSYYSSGAGRDRTTGY